MFRVSIITNQMEFINENFSTKDEAETFILELTDKKDIKHCRMRNTDTNEEEKVI